MSPETQPTPNLETLTSERVVMQALAHRVTRAAEIIDLIADGQPVNPGTLSMLCADVTCLREIAKELARHARQTREQK